MPTRERESVPIAASQDGFFATRAAAPARADGVDHPASGKQIATRELRFAWFAATKTPALIQRRGARRRMDRAVDTTPAEQRSLAALTMASTAKVVMSPWMIVGTFMGDSHGGCRRNGAHKPPLWCRRFIQEGAAVSL